MYAVIDQNTDESPKLTHHEDARGVSIRISYGATSLTMTISEAIDLIDALATTLGSIPEPDPLLGA